MKLKYLSLFAVLFAGSIYSAGKDAFAVGLNIGAPTGPRVRYYITENSFSSTTLGWKLGNGGWLDMHQDFLISSRVKRQFETGKLFYYYGMGMRIKTNSTTAGIRFPAGMEYHIGNFPVRLYIEAGPFVQFYKKTGFDMFLSVGIIYYLF